MAGNRRAFDWSELTPDLMPSLRVVILEALSWIDRPLSPAELQRVFSRRFGLSLVAYHVNKLADAEILEKVGQREVRGAVQSFYFFPRSRTVQLRES
jgi:hypothetical protein